MKSLHYIIFILSANLAYGDLLTTKEINRAQPPTSHTWEVEREWELGKGTTFQALFSFTKRGNGGLHLGDNLWVSVWDCHNDTSVFSGDLLKMTLQDLNNDGFLDLKISGSIDFYDEKGKSVIHKEAVDGEFIYSPEERIFKPGSLHGLTLYKKIIEQAGATNR